MVEKKFDQKKCSSKRSIAIIVIRNLFGFCFVGYQLRFKQSFINQE